MSSGVSADGLVMGLTKWLMGLKKRVTGLVSGSWKVVMVWGGVVIQLVDGGWLLAGWAAWCGGVL